MAPHQLPLNFSSSGESIRIFMLGRWHHLRPFSTTLFVRCIHLLKVQYMLQIAISFSFSREKKIIIILSQGINAKKKKQAKYRCKTLMKHLKMRLLGRGSSPSLPLLLSALFATAESGHVPFQNYTIRESVWYAAQSSEAT